MNGTVQVLGQVSARARLSRSLGGAAWPAPRQLLGGSAAMQRLLTEIERVATRDAAVVITGESGTGKELIANAIHSLSARSNGPLVTVDCGALSPTLVASELFGHERGAFTGADQQRIGAFEQAHGGTLFLDEIGELPESMQATLLGALERRRFRRLGGHRDIVVDVRLVTATNRNLRQQVKARSFRLDLYYRIAVVPIEAPPLREHPEDIPMLIEAFLRDLECDRLLDELFPDSVMAVLAAHPWPGNVRELRNVVEAAVALGRPPPLVETGLDDGDPLAQVLVLPYSDARERLLNVFEKRYFRRLLDQTRGNVSRAAQMAKMNRSHLTNLIRRHRLR